MLVPFTLFHVLLILTNRTTLEYVEGTARLRRADDTNTEPVDPDDGSDRTHERLLSALAKVGGQPPRPSSEDDAEVGQQATRLSRAQEREYQRIASKHNVFNVGLCANVTQAMGRHWWLWWVPVNMPCVLRPGHMADRVQRDGRASLPGQRSRMDALAGRAARERGSVAKQWMYRYHAVGAVGLRRVVALPHPLSRMLPGWSLRARCYGCTTTGPGHPIEWIKASPAVSNASRSATYHATHQARTS